MVVSSDAQFNPVPIVGLVGQFIFHLVDVEIADGHFCWKSKERYCVCIWFNDGDLMVFGTRNTPDLCLCGWARCGTGGVNLFICGHPSKMQIRHFFVLSRTFDMKPRCNLDEWPYNRVRTQVKWNSGSVVVHLNERFITRVCTSNFFRYSFT